MKIFSDISLLWLIPWGVISVAVAIWYYRKQTQLEGVAKWKKQVLTALRATSLFLLGLILFGLLFETTDSKTEKPVFISLFDNSSSMLNYKDSAEVKQLVKEFDNKLTSRFGDRFDFASYIIDDQVSEGNVQFDGNISNLDAGFDHIYNQYYNRNIGGICFVSDGNFNKGNSPVYTAEKIALTPIFTIGVGDTTLKRDQVIRNVAVNDVAFFKNQFPVEIDLEANKMRSESSELSIYQGEQKIASEIIHYNGDPLEYKHVSFVLDANQVGFTNYTVVLKDLEGESSFENNRVSFYVEVVDSRSKVLMLAMAPHPDLAAIKHVLDKDENTDVVSKLISDWDGKLDDVELLIFHGAGVNNQSSLLQRVKNKNIPVFYMVPRNASVGSVRDLKIGLTLPGGRSMDDVQGHIDPSFQLFEVSEAVENLLQKSPPIQVRFGGVNQTGGATLIGQRIGPVKKKEPILYFSSSGKQKFGVFVGEGLWRWKLSEYARSGKNEGFNELVQKSVQYLVVKRNTDPLRINMPKRFSINDDVIINAEFYNSALEPITTPDINYTLTSESGKTIPYTFAKKLKDYRLSLGKLEPGKYSWKAETSFDGKRFKKEGVFIVVDISLEAMSTAADHGLLKTISANSDGGFYSVNQLDKMFSDIAKRKDIVNVSYEETEYSDLIDWKWIFALVALLLSVEWFLRRYNGTY